MKIGIDFGITHTDVAITDDKGTNFQTFKSLKINQEMDSFLNKNLNRNRSESSLELPHCFRTKKALQANDILVFF